MFARALRGSGLRVFVGVGGFLSSFSTPYADHGPAHAAPARRQRQDAPPTPARTTFTLVHGNPNAKEEDTLTLPSDSPVVSSLSFIDWTIDSDPPANGTASAPRSKVVPALLLATRRPSLLDFSRLEEWPFIGTEVASDEATRWASALDTADAFESTFSTIGAWGTKAKSLAAQATDPEQLRLREDSFTTITDWDSDAGPAELAFLARASIADMLHAEDSLSDEAFQPRTLARACLLMGSKDNQTERDDDSSTVRLASEQISGILRRDMRNDNPSVAGLASRFVRMLRDVHLPATFSMQAFSAESALREFELGYNYAHSSAAEAQAIEAELFLNTGHQFPIFEPLLERFETGPEAAGEFQRLSLSLLPAALTSATNMVKLPALSELLRQASWRSTVAHLINASPTISGTELVTSLVRTHSEVSGGLSGGASGSFPAASSSSLVPDTYGSIRDSSIADALRSDEASAALAAAATQSGVERVETIMQSGCVLLTRAELLQEAWLHNKHPTLAFSSLDQPSIRPYFSQVLVEDSESGEVPSRLASYVIPSSEIATVRTRTWSALDLLGQALEIKRLQHGTAFMPVKANEIYVVDSCLRLIKEHGSRFFFALNLALEPANGYAFTDGVDLQLKAVDFARSLPKDDCAEWLTFLTDQFKQNWLDAGGDHYHSKLRSGRPDAPEAQLSEFLPLDNAFTSNVNARMKRAEPVAEFRMAFPSMFSSDKVALPGTSSSAIGMGPPNPKPKPDKGKGKDKDKQLSKRKGDAEASGPGSKSSLAVSLSTSEMWIAGVVFKLDQIAQHYKMARPDHVCWPVLLSKKKGPAALEICPDHATHGDLNQAVHKRPSNFNLDYVYKHFTRAATASENKNANWEPPKKKKP